MVLHTYSHLHKYALRCKNFLLRLRENIPTLGKNYSPVREKRNPAPAPQKSKVTMGPDFVPPDIGATVDYNSELMNLLWDHPQGLTVKGLLESYLEPQPAYTTVAILPCVKPCK